MAPDVRAIADISSIVGNYYDKLMLERLINRCFLYNLSEKRPLPKGSGNVINMNRFTNFPSPLTKLTEGEVPTIKYLSGSAVTATLFQVGDFCAVSDMLTLTSFSNVVEEAVKNFGDSASSAIDKHIFSALTSGHATDNYLNVRNGDDVGITTFYGGKQGGLSIVFISADGLFISTGVTMTSYLTVAGNAHAGIGGGYAMDLSKIAYAATSLRTKNVRPFSDGYYKAVMNSKTMSQILLTAEWASWQQYTRPETLDKGEVGRAYGVKFYESNVIDPIFNSSFSVGGSSSYFTPIWGQGAFAVTELDTEKGVKTYVKSPNNSDTSNPINQWSTIGWKVTMAAKTLNASCGYVIHTIG